MAMPQFAKATGQFWKYSVWVELTVAEVLVTLAFFSLWRGNPLHLPEGLTTGAFFIIALVWFIWLAVAIRCPKCGKSPAWYQMTHGKARTYGDRILATTACPSCGFNPVKENSDEAGETPVAD